MPKPCPFCSIASGELPASIVLREERLIAFLDAKPVFQGHVLIVPLLHIDDFETLPAGLMLPMMAAAQRIARAQELALGAQGAFIAINHRVSQSVPHLHLHVVPRKKGDGLRGFFWPRTSYASDAERDEVADRIAVALGEAR